MTQSVAVFGMRMENDQKKLREKSLKVIDSLHAISAGHFPILVPAECSLQLLLLDFIVSLWVRTYLAYVFVILMRIFVDQTKRK